MQHIISVRRLAALTLTAGAICAIGGQAAVAAPATAVTRTFSFIGEAELQDRDRCSTTFDGLVINARCTRTARRSCSRSPGRPPPTSSPGCSTEPVGCTSMKNTSFTNKTKGIQLSPSNNDFDSTGSVLFETLTGQVVTVNIAFDNSTTLVRRNLCTVFGSYIAT